MCPSLLETIRFADERRVGKLKVESGKLKVESGKLRVESGKLRVESGNSRKKIKAKDGRGSDRGFGC